MDCFILPMYDPLLLRPGTLLQSLGDLIGVETRANKETVLYKDEIMMFLDVQPSKRGRDYYRFKVLCDEYIYVEASLQEFKKWFFVVYKPSW